MTNFQGASDTWLSQQASECEQKFIDYVASMEATPFDLSFPYSRLISQVGNFSWLKGNS